ncbi:MAG: 8-oxo-dGTP diphosphatase [Oscillospiraceae bacterium]|nr:8-oxo-dGTP diphosphatase [Oscillospiraceae bacterium]
MKRTEQVELTVLCMVYDGTKLLLQNRVKADWQGLTFPGGHIEPGESIVEAVIRETREETGLLIQNPILCGVKQFPMDGGRYLVFLFKTDCFSGTLTSSEEGTMEWVEQADLSQRTTVDDFEELLAVMQSDKLTEFQYLVNGDDWTVSLH